MLGVSIEHVTFGYTSAEPVLQDFDLTVAAGEMFVVPCGVEHKPYAEEEAHVLLFEPRTVLNTGDVVNDLSALVGDPNVTIHEAKVFVCRVSKVGGAAAKG